MLQKYDKIEYLGIRYLLWVSIQKVIHLIERYNIYGEFLNFYMVK